MARVYAPFLMTRTIGDLTFYMMDGVNYVRIKSSLTRKRVLKSPWCGLKSVSGEDKDTNQQ